MNTAEKVFENLNYQASEEEIRSLEQNVILLNSFGLEKLNERLRNDKRNVLDTITEHNFAVMLAKKHGLRLSIDYEPGENLRRPPDFKMKIKGKVFWVQVKNLAKLEGENRQYKVFKKIKEAAKDIKIGRFLICMLSTGFKESDIPALMQFIEENAMAAPEMQRLFFPSRDQKKARIEFSNSVKKKLSYLTLAIYGDLHARFISAQTDSQIRQSFLKAAQAFEWPNGEEVFNLIAVDAGVHDDIDICDVLFGKEFYVIERQTENIYPERKNDGLFCNPLFRARIAGVLVMRRKQEIPFSDYHMMLCLNSESDNCLCEIEDLVSLDNVIYPNMIPGETGYFNIA